MMFRFVVSAAIAALLAVPVTIAAGQQDAPKPPAAGPTTSVTDQVDLSLTVYNSDLALIRDVRQLTLPSGPVTLKFADVAAAINPATVLFRSLTEPSALTVLEQNYEYDLLEPEKLLRKYVGRDITIVRDRRAGGARGRGNQGPPARLQQRPGVEDRQRDRDRPPRGPIPLP